MYCVVLYYIILYENMKYILQISSGLNGYFTGQTLEVHHLRHGPCLDFTLKGAQTVAQASDKTTSNLAHGCYLPIFRPSVDPREFPAPSLVPCHGSEGLLQLLGAPLQRLWLHSTLLVWPRWWRFEMSPRQGLVEMADGLANFHLQWPRLISGMLHHCNGWTDHSTSQHHHHQMKSMFLCIFIYIPIYIYVYIYYNDIIYAYKY